MLAISSDRPQKHLARGGSEIPQVVRFRRARDRRNPASREQLLLRVRAEFDEFRSLKVTLAQAQRLFAVREDVCQRVLDTLIREGLLRLGVDDRYARRDLSRT